MMRLAARIPADVLAQFGSELAVPEDSGPPRLGAEPCSDRHWVVAAELAEKYRLECYGTYTGRWWLAERRRLAQKNIRLEDHTAIPPHSTAAQGRKI